MLDQRLHSPQRRSRSRLLPILFLALGAPVPVATTAQAQNCEGCVYANAPDIGPANVATPISAGASVAIGVNAQSSSPTGGGNSIAIGANVTANGEDSIAIGANTSATADNTLAIGNNGTIASAVGATAIGEGAVASGLRSVAIGVSSVALRPGLIFGGREDFSGESVASINGDFSVGWAGGGERQVTNVAGGTEDTDAVNLRQLKAVANGLAGTLGSGYDSDGSYTTPSYTFGGSTYTNVDDAFGAVDRLSLQYTPDASDSPTSTVDLSRGGTLDPVSITGLAAATTEDGAVSLSQMALRYSSASAPTTADPATPSNDVTLVGADATQPVLLHNVGRGTLSASSNDAVNGTQLYETNQAIAALESGGAGLVRQDAATRGLTVGAGTDGDRIDFSNANGASRRLTGIDGGSLAAGSRDAVNGGQVRAVSSSLAAALGGGSAVDPDGTISAPSYSVQGVSHGDVGSAIGGLDAAVQTIQTTGTRYVAVNSSGAAANAAGADSIAIGPDAIASQAGGVALGAGSVADRPGLSGGTEAFSGMAVGSTNGAVSIGSAGGERQLANVAGGTLATDAVNVRQLRGIGEGLAGGLGGGASLDADGRFVGPSYAVGGAAYGNVGEALAAVAALSDDAIGYDVDASTGRQTNSVTLDGGSAAAPVMVRNVADGTAETDAVNVRQMNAAESRAKTYADDRIASLGSDVASLGREIDEVRGEAHRAAAIGLAAGSMRFDDRPGKLSVAAGSGVWQDEAALAFGLGYTLPDDGIRVNAFGVTAGGDVGAGAGVSFTLN